MATNIPLTFDEAHNILLARSSIFPLKAAVSNDYPPLYFTIWHLWQKISETLIWNRLLGVAMGVASIAVTYFTLKKTISRQVAHIAAFLTAVTPGHVYYSTVARMYAPGILLATLFCLYAILYLKEKRLRIGFFIVTLMGLYTHYYFFILWFLTSVWILINLRRHHFSIQPWLKFSGVIALFLTPLTYEMTQTSPLIGSFVNPPLKLPAFYLTPLVPWDMAQQLPIIKSLSIDNLSLLAVSNVLTGILILLVIVTHLRYLKRFHALAFVFFMAPPFIWLLLHLGYPIAGLRSFAIFLPCFLFLSGAALGKLGLFKQRVIVALITILSVVFLAGYVSFYTGTNDTMTSFYQSISSKDIVAYSDIILYLPTRVLKPKGKHIALHPGYLDTTTLKALDVEVTPYTDLHLDASLWYVKQLTNWPPFDISANKIDTYFAYKYKEIERRQIDSYELIRYEKLPQ